MWTLFSRWRRPKIAAAPKPSVSLAGDPEMYYQDRPPRNQDRPLAAIYRIYWSIVADDVFAMRNEIEYFWNRDKWKVCDIPDPNDPEPERYAVVAAIPFILVTAFNNLIMRGMPRDAPSIMTSDELDEAM